MTQAKLLKIVAYIAVASLALPLLVGASGGDYTVSNKLAKYLQLSPVVAMQPTGKVGGTDAENNVPASNLLGQPLGNAKDKPATPATPAAPDASAATPAPAPSTSAAPETPAPAPSTPVAPAPTTVTPAKTSSTGDKAASTYVVKDGDTYGCIAEKYYGSFEQYQNVMDANWAATTPGYGEYHLDVGAKLTLPAVAASNVLPATSICK
jgi:nucleoid-associated protein YgaU